MRHGRKWRLHTHRLGLFRRLVQTFTPHRRQRLWRFSRRERLRLGWPLRLGWQLVSLGSRRAIFRASSIALAFGCKRTSRLFRLGRA